MHVRQDALKRRIVVLGVCVLNESLKDNLGLTKKRMRMRFPVRKLLKIQHAHVGEDLLNINITRISLTVCNCRGTMLPLKLLFDLVKRSL